MEYERVWYVAASTGHALRIELANSLVRAKEEVLIPAEERMKLLKYIVDGCVEERVSPLMNMLAESVSEWNVILYEEENVSSGSESEEDSDNDWDNKSTRISGVLLNGSLYLSSFPYIHTVYNVFPIY